MSATPLSLTRRPASERQAAHKHARLLRMRISTTCALLCLLLVGTACEANWKLDLRVVVSARRQAEYDDYPAQLVLVTDTSANASIEGPEGHAVRLANLCRAENNDFVVELQLDGDDCAQLPRFVQAWLEPREEGAESKCGELDEPTPLERLRRVPDSSLQAESAAFTNFSGECADLREAITLKLDW